MTRHPLWKETVAKRTTQLYLDLVPEEINLGLPEARKILDPVAYRRYARVGAAAQVPAAVVGLIHALESDQDFGAHLANGDPLFDREGNGLATVHRPQGLGPFQDWEAGAVAALLQQSWRPYVRPGQPCPAWRIADAAYFLSLFNGLGYHNKGLVATPYLFGRAACCPPGLYVDDNVWDPRAETQQAGALLILKALEQLEPAMGALLLPLLDVKQAQAALNELMPWLPPLKLDGRAGVKTKSAWMLGLQLLH